MYCVDDVLIVMLWYVLDRLFDVLKGSDSFIASNNNVGCLLIN